MCVCLQCAVTCGHGYQMRAVRCVSGAYGKTVDDRECNAASRPRDSQVRKTNMTLRQKVISLWCVVTYDVICVCRNVICQPVLKHHQHSTHHNLQHLDTYTPVGDLGPGLQ